MTAEMPDRVEAAEAYIRALRSGEESAARRAEPFLAEGVEATLASGTLKGRQAVLEHISGDWPNTPVLAQGGWSDPQPQGDQLVVEAEFPAFGAGASSGTVTFSFDGEGRISAVTESFAGGGRPEPQKEIPLVVRGLINSALAQNIPMSLAYVDEDGSPNLSLRGSVQVFSPTQLCLWLRSTTGGLARALTANPRLSLLFRDSKTRTTLVVKGRGHIDDDPAVRDRVFRLVPEVEQNHDPNRTGAALLIDVTDLRGGTPRGPVLVQP